MRPPHRKECVMPKYLITKKFRDATGMRLPGEVIELPPARAAALRDSGLIGGEYVPTIKENDIPTVSCLGESGDTVEKTVEVEDVFTESEADEESQFPQHVGGGYYQLSNGEKVKGKENAMEAEKALGGE